MFQELVRFVMRPQVVVGWVMFTLAATIMGPFNTLVLMPDGRRLLYWGGIVGFALLLSHILATLIARVEPNARSWRADLMRIGGMVVLFSPMVYGWTLFMVPSRLVGPPSLLRIALFVGLIGTVLQVSKRIARGDPVLVTGESGSVPDLAQAEAPDEEPEAVPAAEPEAASTSEPEPRLMRRLPDGTTGPVVRLSARDHFVDVVLPDEEHSLRMRFTDAIAEMDAVEGYCCHRSHWVARAAITEIERDSGRIYLRLSNGDKIPVSRTYKPGLEEAGIL